MRCELRHAVSSRADNPTGLRPYADTDAALVEQLDTNVFGISRGPLLRSLLRDSSKALVHDSATRLDGYGLLRAGACALYLGALIASSPDSATHLVLGLLSRASRQPL